MLLVNTPHISLPAADEAVRRCASMLHRNLLSIAPLVAFYKDRRVGQPLPGCTTFSYTAARFCSVSGLELADYQAFKQHWLVSSEGTELCQHERTR